MGICVYKFGLLRPVEGADLVDQQMRGAHAYYNKLIEIERSRRAALREEEARSTGAEADAAASAKLELGRVLDAERAWKVEHRTTKIPPEMKEEKDRAREVLKAAVNALREARKAAKEQNVADRINEEAGAARRAARGESGVYWGTYLLEEAAAQAAGKVPLYDGAEPNDPRFRRWTGDGRVGVQVQNGMDAAALFEDDTRLRIDPVDERAWHGSRGERKFYRRTVLWFRVGSEGRSPVWAKFPMTLHREFPKGARVKSAVVHKVRRGPRDEWSVDFTLEVPDRRLRGPGSGRVTIDLGWRSLGETKRACAWKGDDGRSGELLLPDGMVGAHGKTEELASLRDRMFNEARAALKAWLAEQPEGRLPEWLEEAARYLPHWRSVGRLAGLARRWASTRFAGDEGGYLPLEAWRYRDHHLWSWQENGRLKVLRRRKDVFRKFAAGLAREYRTVVLEDFDLRKVIRDDAENRSRAMVAPSELRTVLLQAFDAHEFVNAAWTTQDCAACGARNEFDAAKHLRHTCTECGQEWDQDANAAENLLTRGVVRNSESVTEDAHLGETKWARAARLRDERKARMADARLLTDNPAE